MDKELLLQKYLDGELSSEKEREALHIFADDPHMREMLRFDQRLQRGFRRGAADTFSVPSGFSDRVMNSLKTADKASKHDLCDVLPFVAEKLRWLWQPKQLQLRPVYVFAGAVLLLISLTWIDFPQMPAGQPVLQAGQVQPVSNKTAGDEIWVRFVFFDDDAKTVEIAGDFSNWQPISLTRQSINGEYVWTGLVALERGEHKYMFVVNGTKWVTDPLAPAREDDGFGNKNAVIYL